jgi:hypothetical protein
MRRTATNGDSEKLKKQATEKNWSMTLRNARTSSGGSHKRERRISQGLAVVIVPRPILLSDAISMPSQFILAAEESLRRDVSVLKSWCDQERGRRTALAKTLRISASTIGSWFANRILPTTIQSLVICEFLEQSKSWPSIEAHLMLRNARLRERRALHRMTAWCDEARGRRVDIAAALNTEPTSIGDWIKGKSRPRAVHFRAIELFLNQ